MPEPVPAAVSRDHVPILDIRTTEISLSIGEEIHRGLRPSDGQAKTLPTLLLYDAVGLRLFEEITYLDEYYLTNAEIEVLEKYADHIAAHIQQGSQMIELGSGNLRKVNVLLQALERAEKQVDYYALDLSRPELERTFANLAGVKYRHVRCLGLWGTYDDGLEWLKRPDNRVRPKCILSLGSSIGNFGRTDAATFLRNFATELGPHDFLLIGIDGCQDGSKVYHAYNDRYGKTHEFILNGLVHANDILGEAAFKIEDWKVVGKYDQLAGRHYARVVPVRDTTVAGTHIPAGESIQIEESFKYSPSQTDSLWDTAGLVSHTAFGDGLGEYRRLHNPLLITPPFPYKYILLIDYCQNTLPNFLHMAISSDQTLETDLHVVSKPSFVFPLKAEHYGSQPVPSISEFEKLWSAWDTVTQKMIPQEEMLSKPIKLRNCCLFYLGHIPTFLDIQLTKATGTDATEPRSHARIFERGIDPDVDNPEHCHAHSEIPDTWPPLGEILAYQADVRKRTRSFYKNEIDDGNRRLGKALWLAFEHEAMHLETLLYMLLQSDVTIPPPGPLPDFEVLAEQARRNAVPDEWVRVPARHVTLGMVHAEKGHESQRYFGWDNEHGPRTVKVHAFEAKARAITNGEYSQYLVATTAETLPASWTRQSPKHAQRKKAVDSGSKASVNGGSVSLTDAFLKGKAVRTVYGPVALDLALDWPVMASYDELARCAAWMGGRIPTVEEARSMYSYVDELRAKSKEPSKVLNGTMTAVNGHLSNEGVEESPPSHPCQETLPNAEQLANLHHVFTDLEGCNVGFHNFHPLPVTQNGNTLSGQGDMGGVWEWTSSVLEKHDGFEPMPEYPAYTADFFDGKHNIMLGGSWATHPRIAGRKTFVNWYQRNYLYPWAGARLVRDV